MGWLVFVLASFAVGQVMSWRQNPASHAELHYQPDSYKASVANLLEQLAIARSERDEAKRLHWQSEKRRELLMDELQRAKALLLRQVRKRSRRPAQPDRRQLSLL